MEFKKGFTIKPKEIDEFGVVVFTDGTNDVMANEIVCKAYGYKYDKDLNLCVAFDTQKFLSREKKSTTVSNDVKGVNNKVESGSSNTFIIGDQNTSKGETQNTLIVGEKNEVDSARSNILVTGVLGKAYNNAELVIGGGTHEIEDETRDIAGVIQTSFYNMNGTSSSTDPIFLAIANVQDVTDLNSLDHMIQKVSGSIMTLEATVTALEKSPNAGNFTIFKIECAVKVSNDGSTTTFTQQSRIFPDDNVVFASGKFTGSSSGITENKASNLTASRTSTGVYAFAFQNRTPADENYIVHAQIIEPTSTQDDIKIHVEDGSQSTSGFTVRVYEGDNGGSPDTARDRAFYVSVFTLQSDNFGGLLSLPHPTFSDSAMDGGITLFCTGLVDKTIVWNASIKQTVTKITNDF
jgi:hypothetical protein